MPIHSVTIGNFKGIAESVTIPIKPITIFIGENSSGKSTVLHALAALSQTASLPNDQRALILDDEKAAVHLGRFIEIIHSRKYSDVIELGINVGEVQIQRVRRELKEPNEDRGELVKADVEGSYRFKSTKRTQDISITSGEIRVGDEAYRIKQGTKNLVVESTRTGSQGRFARGAGFILRERIISRKYLDFLAFISAQRALANALVKTYYLGPFRQSPRRSYPTRGASPNQVGSEGESTIPLLANEAVQSKSRPHINQIAEWLEMMKLGAKIDVSRVATSDLFDVSVQLPDGTDFPIADLGFGLSQVLPVLTQLSFAPNGSTLLFEQPELHLHPLAQRPLASVFIDAIHKRDIHIVAETHSPQMITQFHREVRDNKLSPDEIALYRVTRRGGKSHIERMYMDGEGEFHKNSINGPLFNDWRNGFCE
jgi:predicted ATPase